MPAPDDGGSLSGDDGATEDGATDAAASSDVSTDAAVE
jgi:hypothetical protein